MSLLLSPSARNVGLVSFSTELGCPRHVRFTPDGDQTADIAGGLVRAQQQTHAVQQVTSLFDHFVGTGKQRCWNAEAECFGGLEFDDQLDFGRLLHRKVARL
jgi:hypothetical protein